MQYTRDSVFSLKEVEDLLKKKVLNNLKRKKKTRDLSIRITTINNKDIYTLSDRYKTFFTKGYKCVHCGLEAKFWALERAKYDKTNSRYHLNLYAFDKDGNEILMTKDHIVPKSKGGNDKIENFQTMCILCNNKKGNKL